MPSSVVILMKEKSRQPASQCRSSILTIFMFPSRGSKLFRSELPAESCPSELVAQTEHDGVHPEVCAVRSRRRRRTVEQQRRACPALAEIEPAIGQVDHQPVGDRDADATADGPGEIGLG